MTEQPGTQQPGTQQPGTQPPATSPTQQWPLPRGLLVMLGAAALVVTVAGIRGIAGIIGPLFLALMITIGVSPVRRWLGRIGCPSVVSTIVTIVLAYAIIIGLAVALAVSIAMLATQLPEYSDQFNRLVGDVSTWLADKGVGDQQIQSALSRFNVGSFVGYLTTFLQSLLSIFSNIFFILTLLLFMAVDAAGFSRRLDVVAIERPLVVTALRSFADGTKSYLVVSTIFGAVVGVLDGLALWAVGVPLPVLWGLLSFITNYIPNIGFVVGVVPPMLLALLGDGWQKMLLVLAIYGVLNVVIQTFIQPRIVGDAVGLSVSVTFLSLIFWAWALGALGALLAIPMTLLAKALLIDIDPSSRWVLQLVSARSPDQPTMPYVENNSAPDREPDAEPDAAQLPRGL